MNTGKVLSMSDTIKVGESSDRRVLQYLDHDQLTSDKTLSPTNSVSTAGNELHLSPKASISKKPIRRRSRQSKQTQITLLNASTANFRALVQQFTGCSRSTTTLSFSTPRKGPVDIKFPTNIPTSTVSLGFNNTLEQTPATQQYQYQHQHQHQEMYHLQEQQSMLLFQKNDIGGDHDDYTSSSCGNFIPNTQTLEDFFLENISLYDLIGDAN